MEAGARDGLQNVKKSISVEDKVKFITLLEKAGLRNIEAGSFVSPKWVPQVGTVYLSKYIDSNIIFASADGRH